MSGKFSGYSCSLASATALGAVGRGFESLYPDTFFLHMIKPPLPCFRRFFRSLEIYPQAKGRFVKKIKKKIARFFFVTLERLSVPFERQLLGGSLPNCYRIHETLFRGGQPGLKGLKHLQKLGVKTVINLRSFESNMSYQAKLDLEFVHLPVNLYRLKETTIIQFLKTIATSKQVFIHCFHGSDRTGMFIAIYRMVFLNWSKEAALEEMMKKEYGFHACCKHLIDFVKKLNIRELIYRADLEHLLEDREKAPLQAVSPQLPQNLEVV